MGKESIAWWLSFGSDHDACVVETPADGDVLDAVALACRRNCCGAGDVDATFGLASDVADEVPRRLWYRLRSVEEWRSLGVEPDLQRIPGPSEPCPLCVEEERQRNRRRP